MLVRLTSSAVLKLSLFLVLRFVFLMAFGLSCSLRPLARRISIMRSVQTACKEQKLNDRAKLIRIYQTNCNPIQNKFFAKCLLSLLISFMSSELVLNSSLISIAKMLSGSDHFFLSEIRTWILFPVLLLIFNLLTGFNGLYGQDSFEYLRYSRELHEYLSGGELPGTFFWPVLYPLSGAVVSFFLPDVLSLQVVSVFLLWHDNPFSSKDTSQPLPWKRKRDCPIHYSVFLSFSFCVTLCIGCDVGFNDHVLSFCLLFLLAPL